MIRFIRVFWSIVWRSLVIIMLSTGITYGLSELVHSRFAQSEFSIKLRLSLTFLPAALMFAILAMRTSGFRNFLLEHRSAMSSAKWRQTYAGLSVCAFSIVAISCAAALTVDTDTWVALRALLPLPLFALFWIGLAIWQVRSAGTSPAPENS
jgi:intracellular septation protein A